MFPHVVFLLHTESFHMDRVVDELRDEELASVAVLFSGAWTP
jgi:hypothetical protein